ncbi:MAG: ABC transporter permease [Candidatus Zixiibacteriota bacterium]
MGLLLAYSFRNIFTRKLTSILTIVGIALVVFVFAAIFMLANGLYQTLVDTGYDENVIVIRKASQTEVQSIIYRDMANVIKADQAIQRIDDGACLFTNAILVLITQPKRGSEETSNVPVRGVAEKSISLRPDFKLIEGRMWRPGTSEIIAGAKAAKGFQGCGLGETVRFGMRDWTVVGVFELDNSGFESELWGDVEQLMDAFHRPVYSSLTFRLESPSEFTVVKERLENDPRLAVEVQREKEYYAEQSEFTATFLKGVGIGVCFFLALGAVFGAMITMYASVANRTVEIGTLRALGFRRRTVLRAFLVESVLIALIGGAIGILVAYFLRYVEISTTNWNTFAELAFSFEMSPSIAISAMVFAILMGIAGGFFPAVRAASLRIINALRAK